MLYLIVGQSGETGLQLKLIRLESRSKRLMFTLSSGRKGSYRNHLEPHVVIRLNADFRVIITDVISSQYAVIDCSHACRDCGWSEQSLCN